MFNLDEPERYRLDRAPLAQALAQVRFPLVAHLQSISGVAPIQDRLATRFPYMEQQQVQEFGFVLGPAGVSGAGGQANVNWQFTDDEGRLFTLAPNSASFSVGSQYAGIEDFSERFSEILVALGEIEQIRRCDRLGVRYLSLAEQLAGADRTWRKWFNQEIVAWVGSDVIFPGSLASSLTQTELVSTSPGTVFEEVGQVRGLLRSGVVPAEAVIQGLPPVKAQGPSFILDLDLFVESPQRFDQHKIREQFLALHSQIDRFFLWSLTEEGRVHFGYRVIND